MTDNHVPAGNLPLATIVIPCYNGARYIDSALRSALQQTHQAIEVIVIDDGSTDDSPAIIRSFGERVRSVRIKNSGQSAARNLGVQLAHGEYIQFLDADNILLPTKIERAIEVFQHAPAADAVFCGLFTPPDTRFDHTYTPQLGALPNTEEEALDEVYLPWGYTGIPSLETSMPVYRRSAFEKGGLWNENLSVWEDLELNTRLFLAGVVFRYVHMLGIVYRDHTGERVTNRSAYYNPAMLRTLRTLVQESLRSPALTPTMADYAAKFLIWIAARDCVAHGRFGTAHRYLELARRFAPEGLPGPEPFPRLARLAGPLAALTLLHGISLAQERRQSGLTPIQRLIKTFR